MTNIYSYCVGDLNACNIYTGVADKKSKLNLEVNPNPATDFIVIKNIFNEKNCSFQITDELGKPILSEKITQSPNQQFKLLLRSGFYILTIYDQNEILLRNKILILSHN